MTRMVSKSGGCGIDSLAHFKADNALSSPVSASAYTPSSSARSFLPIDLGIPNQILPKCLGSEIQPRSKQILYHDIGKMFFYAGHSESASTCEPSYLPQSGETPMSPNLDLAVAVLAEVIQNNITTCYEQSARISACLPSISPTNHYYYSAYSNASILRINLAVWSLRRPGPWHGWPMQIQKKGN